MTGDGLMRKVAVREGVEVMGTLRILDDLFLGSYINPDRYREVLLKLKKENGKKVRLPKAEIERRIQSLV